MTHFATEFAFASQATFIISARRAGRAAGASAGPERGFAQHLERARAVQRSTGPASLEGERAEEDAERWDGMS